MGHPQGKGLLLSAASLLLLLPPLSALFGDAEHLTELLASGD